MSLRATVEAYCRRKTGRAPNLDNPRGYNDKLAWLKLHDQMPEQPTCCDKLAAREYVAGIIGRGYLLKVHQIARRASELQQRVPAMVKANHDSGTATRAVDGASWRQACERIDRAIARPFGIASGEWAYRKIERRCFTERLLPSPVVEYKIHCSAGRVLWSQIIVGRAVGCTTEVVTDAEGKRLPLHFNVRNAPGAGTPRLPSTWGHMVEIAETLSRPFRYVRVDLYSSGGRVYFSELTFWPLAGICKTPNEPTFGEMLDIDLSFKRPALA